MRKLSTAILVVLLLFAGLAFAGPSQQPSAAAAQQAASSPSAAPAAETPLQPFTSTDGRFSAYFPGTPTQSSQPVQLKNGETTTLDEFSATADNGNVSYIVTYYDCPPNVSGASPQVFLQRAENGAVAGKTLLSNQVIDLDGIPGRAYTAADSTGYNYTVREFLAGTRFYQLIVTTSKGSTATQLTQFMNSFMIF